MGLRTKIHQWMVSFWEGPFFTAELHRANIGKHQVKKQKGNNEVE